MSRAYTPASMQPPPLSDAELDELRRAWAPTAGPWVYVPIFGDGGYLQRRVQAHPPAYEVLGTVTSEQFGRFLLALREAVPGLVARAAAAEREARLFRQALGLEPGGVFAEVS